VITNLILAATSLATVVAVGSTVLLLAKSRAGPLPSQRYIYTVTSRDGRWLRLVTNGIELRQGTADVLKDLLLGRSDDSEHFEVSGILDRLVNRQYRTTIEEISVRYEIGPVPTGDRQSERHHTTAGQEPLLWREVRTGITGEEAPTVSSFNELPDLRIVEYVDNEELDLPWMPIGRLDDQVTGLVVFKPQIRARSAREWEWGCRTPGLWNPLRERYVDHATYHVNRETQSHSVEGGVCFPTKL
jgi:hypothetical protein